jgi:hypothetical protein
MRLCPEGYAGRPCRSASVGYGHGTAPTEELPCPFRWMVRWKVPRSVPRLLSRLKRYRNGSSGRSSAGSSASSGVTSGDGSSGTSAGAMTSVRSPTEARLVPFSTTFRCHRRGIHRPSTRSRYGRLSRSQSLHKANLLDDALKAVGVMPPNERADWVIHSSGCECVNPARRTDSASILDG